MAFLENDKREVVLKLAASRQSREGRNLFYETHATIRLRPGNQPLPASIFPDAVRHRQHQPRSDELDLEGNKQRFAGTDRRILELSRCRDQWLCILRDDEDGAIAA